MRENIPVIRLRSQSGDLLVRDGLVLCFFMRRSHAEISAAVWRALETYRRAIPPKSLGWYVSDDGDMLPLDEKGWECIRGAWNVQLLESPGEAGGYHFDYVGRKLDDPVFSHDEGATSGVAFSFPTEYSRRR